MSSSSAARTNLTSYRVKVHDNCYLGEGAFRIACEGTYIGGNRNQQEAACKRFKNKYKVLENEFFEFDFQVADKAIQMAQEWNDFCPYGKEILITRGTVMKRNGCKYLVEPLIRYFTKFTSNNGWISNDSCEETEIEIMEAFCHYTYHRSGGSLIVCDLQGRYRYNAYNKKKSRFELTDPAICSRQRLYGPTDMGEKGIESFFHNHVCNGWCHSNGERWQKPRVENCRSWFPKSSQTSMLASKHAHQLSTCNTSFVRPLDPVYEMNYDTDYSDDSW